MGHAYLDELHRRQHKAQDCPSHSCGGCHLPIRRDLCQLTHVAVPVIAACQANLAIRLVTLRLIRYSSCITTWRADYLVLVRVRVSVTPMLTFICVGVQVR